MKKKKEEEHENGERWLLTYSDLITLLMVFFIVMYAMSNVDVEKYKKLSGSLNSALGSGGGSGGGSGTGSKINITGYPTMTEGSKLNVTGLPLSEGESSNTTNTSKQSGSTSTSASAQEGQFANAQSEMTKYLKDNNLGNVAVSGITDKGFQISLKDNILFNSGDAELKESSINKLVSIGKILSKVDGNIRIEGNTDNLPIKTDKYNSNWQLSAIRAANVAELLINRCGIEPSKVAAIGYGEYRPVANNSTPEGRSQNRRVDIVIVDNKYNAIEGNK